MSNAVTVKNPEEIIETIKDAARIEEEYLSVLKEDFATSVEVADLCAQAKNTLLQQYAEVEKYLDTERGREFGGNSDSFNTLDEIRANLVRFTQLEEEVEGYQRDISFAIAKHEESMGDSIILQQKVEAYIAALFDVR